MNYEITEEQIKELAKGNDKVKKMFPEVFETKLEVGKWYYDEKNDWLFCYNLENSAYGFAKGIYRNDYYMRSTLGFRLATDSEVEEALINEAKKKYKVGDCVKCLHDKDTQLIEHLNFSYMEEFNTLVSNIGFNNSAALFDNGKWATPVKTYTKEEAEKLLNAKII